MQIWIYLNGIQQGPYTLEQLQVMGIDPATPVWYEGLTDWTPAGEAPVTAPLFSPVAPAAETAWQPEPVVTAALNDAPVPPKPPTYLVWTLILTILCCNLFGLIGIITGAVSSSRYSAGDYEGAKKMSEVTEWMVILAIVWLIVGGPVALAYSLL